MSTNESDTVLSPSDRKRVLVGLFLTMGLAALDTTIVATAVPSIVGDFGGFSLFPWVFSIYLLAQTVTIPIYGKLSDQYGRKRILIIGTIIFIIGSVLSGASWNMLSLIIFRGVLGLGAGSIQSTVNTVVGDIYPVEQRGRIVGLLSSVWGIAGIAGPLIGGFFSEYLSWRWIFYINVPIAIFALIMIAIYLRENVTGAKHRIDYAGAGLLAAGMGSLILGLLSGGQTWAWTSVTSIIVFALAVVFLIALIFTEKKAKEPIIPLWVFQKRQIFGPNLSGGAIAGVIIIALTTYLPLYGQEVLGVNAVIAGFILGGMIVAWPVASSQSAKLYMKIGFRDTALVGVGFTLMAAILYSLLHMTSPVWLIIAVSGIMGIGIGLLTTSTIIGVQSSVDWQRRGVVTGNNMFSRQLGQSIGAAIFGIIVNSTLSHWLSNAPAGIKGKLPDNINQVTQGVGNTHTSSAAAASYIKHGFYLAIHHSFIGLIAVAIIGILLLLITPRQFKKM